MVIWDARSEAQARAPQIRDDRSLTSASGKAAPNAELVMIEDAGHLPWLDFPELIGRKTAAFLSG